MSPPNSETVKVEVRALLADLGDCPTTRLQRHQLWTAVLRLLREAGYHVPRGAPRSPHGGRYRRIARQLAAEYELLARPGVTWLSVGERIHWLYVSVEDITDIEWLSLLDEIVEDPATQPSP